MKCLKYAFDYTPTHIHVLHILIYTSTNTYICISHYKIFVYGGMIFWSFIFSDILINPFNQISNFITMIFYI